MGRGMWKVGKYKSLEVRVELPQNTTARNGGSATKCLMPINVTQLESLGGKYFNAP